MDSPHCTLSSEKNKWLLFTLFVLTVLFAFFVHKAGFDQDMMHMNYMSGNLKKAQVIMDKVNSYSLRSVYLVTEEKNLESALRKQEEVNNTIHALQEKKLIKKYSGVFQLLISDSLQRARINDWNTYWTEGRKSALLD